MKRLVLFGALLPLLGIAACSRADKDPFADEVKQRDDFVRKLLIEDDAGDTLYTTATSDVQYGAGFGLLSSNPADEFNSKPFRWMGAMAHIRLKRHEHQKMKIVIAGWLHEKMLQTHPSLDVFIDGYGAGSSAAFDNVHYWYEFYPPEWMFKRDWVDLTIRMNAVGFHWDAPPELRTIVLYRFEYKPVE